jgi:hypothetical protein
MRHTLAILFLGAAALSAQIRIGIIGTDTSHAPVFTRTFNDTTFKDHIPGGRVVAAYKGGSKDLESSHTRVDKYAEEISSKWGVEIVPDIETLLSKVDAVLLESVDGRVHLEQVRPVFKAKKPVFIDKPLASTLADAREIARLGKESGTPWFSTSSLRYSDIVTSLKSPENTGVITWGPSPLEKTHQLDLTWYGIHAIEMLYAMMGPGCEEVTRVVTDDADLVVGKWKNGKLGTVRLQRPSSGYGAVAFRAKQAVASDPKAGFSYTPMLREVIKFFETRVAPVPNEETLEMFAFMDAAQRSKAANGQPMKLK